MSAAKWVIEGPYDIGRSPANLWKLGITDVDGNMVSAVYAYSPAECLRLAHLFRAAEAMKEALEAVAKARWRALDEHSGEGLRALEKTVAALRLATPRDTP